MQQEVLMCLLPMASAESLALISLLPINMLCYVTCTAFVLTDRLEPSDLALVPQVQISERASYMLSSVELGDHHWSTIWSTQILLGQV